MSAAAVIDRAVKLVEHCAGGAELADGEFDPPASGTDASPSTG